MLRRFAYQTPTQNPTPASTLRSVATLECAQANYARTQCINILTVFVLFFVSGKFNSVFVCCLAEIWPRG